MTNLLTHKVILEPEETKTQFIFDLNSYLSSQLPVLLPDYEHDTYDILVLKCKSLQNLLHNIYHWSVCRLYSWTFYQDTNTKFHEMIGVSPNIEYKTYLTPDIAFTYQKCVYIIDVTVTNNVEFASSKKHEKYQILKEFVVGVLGLDCKIIALTLQRNLQNFLTEFYKLPFNPIIDPSLISLVFENQFERVLTPFLEIAVILPPSVLNPETYDIIEHIDSNFLTAEDYKKAQLKFNHAKLLQDHIYMEQIEAENIFSKLVSDPEVYATLKETPTDIDLMSKSFNKISQDSNAIPFGNYKPSFHIPYCEYEEIVPQVFTSGKLEQNQIINFLTYVTKEPWGDEINVFSTLKVILHQMTNAFKKEHNWKLFNEGVYTNQDESYKESYHLAYPSEKNWYDQTTNKNLKQEENKQKKTKPKSFRKYLIEDLKLFTDEPQVKVYSTKMVLIDFGLLNQSGLFKDSGTNFDKLNKQGRSYKMKTSCPPDSGQFDEFIDLLLQMEKYVIPLEPVMYEPVGVDVDASFQLKGKLKNDLIGYLEILNKFKLFAFSQHTHRIATQLLHFAEMNTKNNMLYFMTGGQPNILHLVQGSTVNRGDNVGLPFMTLFLTTEPKWISNVYGKIKKIKLTDTVYLAITNWRRLPSFKLGFIRDSFYSTLSTSYNTWARIPKEFLVNSKDIREAVRYSALMKILVSVSTSQVLAEKLMDIRYLFMASISDYSQGHKLIEEKLSGPYPNLMLRWVVSMVSKKIQIIGNLNKSTKLFQTKTPIYTGYLAAERLRESLGGTCNVPSLWSDWTCVTLQDIFDEIFVYVHTLKEPSNLYHESVKAVNTINEYQTKYDKLSLADQTGIHTFESFKDNILKEIKMGCWVDFVYHSSKMVSSQFSKKQNTTDFLLATQFEPVSKITSTKSCIPDYERDYIIRKLTPKDEKHAQHLKEVLLNKNVTFEKFEPKQVILKGMPSGSIITQSHTGRHKVHDCVYDFLTTHPDFQTVLQIANWNIIDNKMRVQADICIKAQYGSKREFYVVNLGAKAMARVFENTFKYFGKLLPQEMISIPGDEKMKHMQRSLDEVIKSSEKKGQLMYYVNGDCTKWSAAETMSSFWALCDGWGGMMSEEHKEFCKTAVAAWGDKKITIPGIILEKNKFITEKTDYMRSSESLKSTQNFLQGMWNYSSSVKAVCATEFAIYMFRKLNPDRTLYCRHLEHSDDYVLIVRVDDIKTFEDFRVYHRLSQRLHGINDSFKKTNSQRYIMEFISLMSFGGQLCYPYIKKLKEVGLNLSCIGYRNDAMNIISRVGEAIRVGVPIASAYSMQLIHGWNLATAYSLVDNRRNSVDWPTNIYNRPLELFGLPDCLPIVYACTKGNPENYRLYTYGNSIQKQMINVLISLTNEQTLTEVLDDINSKSIPTLFSPQYIYKKFSNKIKKNKTNTQYRF